MRALNQREQKKRGCVYCLHHVEMMKARMKGLKRPASERKGEHYLACKWAECPYHELDGIKNYIADYDRPVAQRIGYIKVGLSW